MECLDGQEEVKVAEIAAVVEGSHYYNVRHKARRMSSKRLPEHLILISFFIPVFGLFLFFLYLNRAPRKAKTALKSFFYGSFFILLVFIINVTLSSSDVA
ncbi:hypothetical protein D0T53_00265 [Dysgonomonas sp. 216]|uniref:hypothetical protein n=1 Tax=Dysgonomonas sp. 216 TaxID=2302934 RepID=UPI0013CF4034|nr:hypothetical protein [Dysgonomonas sp. 216]NDW17347.1 hypothetical protein [Dysgonomonas sp. 216]